jgi:hypothetical protein
MNNAAFCAVMSCGSCKNRLLVTANVPSSPIIVTVMIETIRSSETLVLKAQGVTSHKTAFILITAASLLTVPANLCSFLRMLDRKSVLNTVFRVSGTSEFR